jgi:cathepsin B
MRRRSQKQSDFFDKYAYHIVIGGFLLLCLVAFGSTLFRSNKKLSTIPVIDDEEITSHNSQGYLFSLGSNEFFQNWMLSDAKYILNNHLTFKSSIQQCESVKEQNIIPERFNFREQYPGCTHPVYNQGNCSSSYAIAAVTAISDRHCQ